MEQKTVIFFGCTGSGKGTQAKILVDYLTTSDTVNQTFYVETGQRFREFSREANPTAKLIKAILDEGGLMPEFLPIWIWTDFFVKNLSGSEHLVLDGLSRRIQEAPVLDSAMRFYKRQKPHVILINVSEEWATDRIMSRAREDDNKIDVKAKLDWYQKNVVPTLEFFKERSDYYQFHEVNGEQSIEAVAADIQRVVFGN